MICVDVQFERPELSIDITFRSEAPVLGVFGPSGAGKTTLINLIAGIERPDHGSISFHGTILFDGGSGINLATHRRRIGVVFQEHRLFPHYSVLGNLRYGAGRRNDHLQSVVDLLEIGPLLRRKVTHLSGGERQRVALGRALLSNPKLLLLDEPLASLDHQLRQQILPYLRRIRTALDVPIMYVSHELSEILQLTDELLVVDHGRVAGHGRYHDLVHDGTVFSVIHDRGMTNMLPAVVREVHSQEGVASLELLSIRSTDEHESRMTLIAPIIASQPGTRVTLSIQPWDIALAARPVVDTSIRNQLSGVVTRCTALKQCVLVEVDLGAPIFVEISRRSASAMQIEPGRSIVCLIKSHAIRAAEEYKGARRLQDVLSQSRD